MIKSLLLLSILLAPFLLTAASGGPIAADFDNDGFVDMACGNGTTDNMTVWKNNGSYRISTASFTSIGNLATLDNPGRLYTSDLDRDGKMDIVLYYGAGTASSQISVFHNTTTGSISFNRVDYSLPSAGTLAWISDLDGDGRPDILVTSETGNRIILLKNVSSPGVMNASSFESPFSITVTAPRGLATTDINLDGKPEIIINTNSNTLLVYENLVPASCVPATERAALVALYNATNGSSWTDDSNWGSNTQVNSFTGSIPASLANCTDLEVLHLEGNQHTGTIPTFLNATNFPNLFSINLGFNQLTGAIPVELGSLSTLTYLSLADNDLSGVIPTQLGSLTLLGLLDLSRNQLSGNIPVELGSLSSLGSIQLWSNQLTGTIPIELGNLSNLVAMNLDQNQLTGSIPTQFGNLSSLQFMELWGNQLTGAIPVELGNISTLVFLRLSSNLLSGSIPASLGNLSGLFLLDLNNNQLTGSIPSELGNLLLLRYLNLYSNQLTGAVPPEIGNLAILEDMLVYNNQLDGMPTFTASTLTRLGVENNNLEFGDLESNIGTPAGYTYSPQAKLPPGGTLSVNENSPISIPFSTSGTANSYQWFKDGSQVAGATSPTFTKTSSVPADEGTYYVEVTSSIVTGLTLQSDDYVISINAAPVILATLITLSIQGEITLDLIPLITTDNSPLDISSLQVIVTPASGAVATIDANGILTLDYAGINFTGTETLSIRACDQLGNCATQQFEVEVIGEIEIFNALSPNGDNVNEKFIIRYIDVMPDTQNNHVTIYNRWGDVVFEVDNYDNDTHAFMGLNKNDKELPSGTYFYKIEFTSGLPAKSGYLSLKK